MNMSKLVPNEPRRYTKIHETQKDKQVKPPNINFLVLYVAPIAYKLVITSVLSIDNYLSFNSY